MIPLSHQEPLVALAPLFDTGSIDHLDVDKLE